MRRSPFDAAARARALTRDVSASHRLAAVSRPARWEPFHPSTRGAAAARCGRRRVVRRRGAVVRYLSAAAVVVSVALVATLGAIAYWTTGGTGTANASVGSLNAPTNVSASSTPGVGTVDVTWTGSTLTTSTPAQSYRVFRDDGVSPVEASCSPVTGTSCADVGVADGTYTYVVRAIYESWTADSAASNPVTVVNDNVPPTVLSIARADANPTKAGTVSWTVTFSEDVTGVDATDFALAATGLGGTPSITGVTGSDDTYTVTAGTGSGSGTLGLNLVDDDSVADGVGNDLGGTGAGNGDFTGQVYAIDRTAPTVVSITRVGSSPTNASSVQWTVTFSEPVSGVSSDFFDFLLIPSGLGGAAITNLTGGGDAYTVTASTGSGSGTLGLDVVDDDTIQDGVGNALGGTGAGNGGFAGELYTLDRTAPTVVSIDRNSATPTNAASVSWTVTFSEPVTGVDATDFDVFVSGLGGSPAVTLVSGGGSSWTVSASTGTGNGTVRLDLDDDDSIADGVGNVLGGAGVANGDFTTGQAYTIDHTPPTVLSIIRTGPNVTNAASVGWTVTFSEPVSGVDATDFALAASGFSGTPVITLVSGGPTAYTVTATTDGGTPGGSATLGLDVVDDDSIQDAVSNKLGGTGAGNGNFTGAVYIVDKLVPTVVSIIRGFSNPTSSGNVTWTVLFSEEVTGVNAADFSLVSGGGLGGTPAITGVTGGPTSYIVSASTGTGSGTLGLNLVDDDSIGDLVNKLGGTGAGNGNFTGEDYTVDRTAPALSTLEMFDTNANGKVDQVKATFNDTLGTPYTAPNSVWTLANVPSGGTLSSVAVAGAVATLTIAEGAGAANTAVGTFTVALTGNANGIRDAVGNQSTFAATTPADKAGPVPVGLVTFNAATLGKMEAGDSLTLNFSENVAQPASGTVAIREVDPPGGGNDTLEIVGVMNPSSLGGNGYVNNNNRTAAFSASSILVAGTSIVATVAGTCTGDCADLLAGGPGVLTVTPSSTIKDAANNSAAGSFSSGSIRIF